MKDNLTTKAQARPMWMPPSVAMDYLDRFRNGEDTLDIALSAGVHESVVYNSINWARKHDLNMAVLLRGRDG